MPKKIKLNLEDLNVESFKTTEKKDSKGGAMAASYPNWCSDTLRNDCWSQWVCRNSIAGPFCP